MLERSQSDLRRSIRRKLAVRLLLACVPLAVLASATVYYIERDRFGEDVLSWTLTQAALFNAEEGGLLDRLDEIDTATLESAIVQFTGRHDGGWLGRFEAVSVHRESGELAGRLVRQDGPQPEVAAELLGSA